MPGMRALNNLVLASGARVTSGSTFPTSPTPVAGDLHWHTTYRRTALYDGTRWLSEPCYVPFFTYSGSMPYSANGGPLITGVPNRALYMLDWKVNGFLGINNSSNYWTIELHADPAGTLASFTTQTMTQNTYFQQASITTFSNNPVAATNYDIIINITKTGNPGAIELYPSLLAADVLT